MVIVRRGSRSVGVATANHGVRNILHYLCTLSRLFTRVPDTGALLDITNVHKLMSIANSYRTTPGLSATTDAYLDYSHPSQSGWAENASDITET